MYPGIAHSGSTSSSAPSAATASRRARQASRFCSFSPSFGSICATATRTIGDSTTLSRPTERVRSYYDVVCPYCVRGVPSVLSEDGRTPGAGAASTGSAQVSRSSRAARERDGSTELQHVESPHLGLEADLAHQLCSAWDGNLREIPVERVAVIPDRDEASAA